MELGAEDFGTTQRRIRDGDVKRRTAKMSDEELREYIHGKVKEELARIETKRYLNNKRA